MPDLYTLRQDMYRAEAHGAAAIDGFDDIRCPMRADGCHVQRAMVALR